MKHQLRLLACALLTGSCLSATVLQDTQKTLLNQTLTPSYFSRPLEFSRASISFFLQNIFNHTQYPQEHLALNFSHVSQGISLAPQHTHPRRFIKKILSLFSLKLHDIYVNPYAWCTLIEDLLAHTAEFTDTEAEKDYLIEAIKQEIGSCLVEQFERLRYAPDETLNELAIKVYDLVNNGQDISIRELQHSIFYFLMQGMRLIVWSPGDQEDTWYNMRDLASRFSQCAQYNLIDSEMLDDLYWTLLNRYTVFLSIAGAELDPRVYDIACNDMQNDTQAFWNSEERELYITTKFNYLREALMQAEASAHLHAQGYVQ